MPATPRKLPRQSRSRATVDAIVEATTQVLLKEGYDGFTTARAAERAGVSIGSLYQYFPNKAALASAVIDRCCDNFLTAFEEAVTDKATLADSITALVDFAFVSPHLTPELHRIVHELTPRMGLVQRTRLVSRATAQAIESILRKHADEIAPEIDLTVAATLIETTLEALSHRALLAESEAARDDTLIAETIWMIRRYLARDQ